MSSSAPQAFVKNHTLTLHSEDLHVPQPWPAKGITIDARSLSIQLKLVLVWPKDQEQTVEMEIFSEGCFRVGGRWPDAAHEWCSVEASGNCVMPIDSSSVGPEVVASNTACWYSWNQETSEPQTDNDFDDEENAFLVGFKWKLDLGVTVMFEGGDAESGSLLMSCHGNVGILPQLGSFGAKDVPALVGTAVKLANNGSHSSAVRVWQCALVIQTKTQGSESCDLALTLHEMGRSYEAVGELQKATGCIRRALGIRQRQLGMEHPETATTMHTLGALREKAGEHTEALDCYWQALAVREAMIPESTEAAKTLHALGNVHGRTGNLHEALECYQRALTIRERKSPWLATHTESIALSEQGYARHLLSSTFCINRLRFRVQ